MATKPTMSVAALSTLFQMNEIINFICADDYFFQWAFTTENKGEAKHLKLRTAYTPSDTLNVVLYIQHTINKFREQFDILEEEITNLQKYLEYMIGLEDYYADVEAEKEEELIDITDSDSD